MSYFLQFLEAATHSSGLFRTRVASVEAFILRLSRIHDFVLKHIFLRLTRNSDSIAGDLAGRCSTDELIPELPGRETRYRDSREDKG